MNMTSNWTVEVDVERWRTLVDLLLPPTEVSSWLRMRTTDDADGDTGGEEGDDRADGANEFVGMDDGFERGDWGEQ